MISLSELKRRLENIVQVGTVSETKNKEGKALARVILDDDGINKRVSAFLPVVSLANSFAKVWFPLRVDEQVLVISPFGNANSGFIIRSIFNKKCKEPNGSNENTAIVEFEDGTRISYDSKLNDLKIDAVKSINIFCVDVNIEASNTAYVKAPNTTIESETLIKGSLTVEKLFTALGGMKVNPS
ncbi:phage baseplate assembly protein V, partial [Poseidonibacter sp.]|uniref:phage baseplate assembly protein V n=1 Tax=Poseidonibacter sp. TaxID=2321188 RepID=UPI003C75EB73